MLRDDFVMRMVRQLAAALARIAGLRNAGLLDEAAERLDEAFAALGVDPKLAGSADAALLLGLTADPARREALRRLLEERDALAAARGARQPS
ncbi:MAG TPA: hypothetical protein VFM53_02205 [Anaeromyxobacteraceae bacterium]|nr:hypothetical protein [Anaeromyxobacteraceae bacterium]